MYPGTCFHLDQRLRKGGQLRPVVTERSYVAAGGGWIWNAVADRFGMAIQRLDLYHANTCRWAVANHVPSTDPQAARQWVKPLLRQLRSDQVARVITRLSVLTPTLTAAAATAGDEALLALEICWRNDRWEHRFPHVVRPSATPNGTPRPPSFSATPFPRPALAAHPTPKSEGCTPSTTTHPAVAGARTLATGARAARPQVRPERWEVSDRAAPPGRFAASSVGQRLRESPRSPPGIPQRWMRQAGTEGPAPPAAWRGRGPAAAARLAGWSEPCRAGRSWAAGCDGCSVHV